MLNIIKNETIFPEYIKLNICLNLVEKINDIITKYKSNVSDAVVYSLIEQKYVTSEKRKSSKTSFHSKELRDLINANICNLIYSILKYEYPNVYFNISIGEQIFDYIKYDNGGYFDIHTDFVRINNEQQQQYTLLIGLTDKKNIGSDGYTIIWIPVTYQNQYDYKILIEATIFTPDVILIAKKYNLPYYGDVSHLKKLFQINKSDKKYIPVRLNSYENGNALLFKANMLHSGESFYDWYKAKELFGLTINIIGIENNNLDLENYFNDNYNDKLVNLGIEEEYINLINSWLNDKNNKIIKFNKFENWMCEFTKQNQIIPFQIIISSGTYNDKIFSDTYLRYLNLDDSFTIETLKDPNVNTNLLEKINITLIEIYSITKNKLNTRGRETHIESKINNITENIEQIQALDSIIFNLSHIDDTIQFNNISFDIQNYFLNWTHANNSIITRTEKILNTWEESTCNDDGDEYYDTTYLNCNIDIKFCFYKL